MLAICWPFAGPKNRLVERKRQEYLFFPLGKNRVERILVERKWKEYAPASVLQIFAEKSRYSANICKDVGRNQPVHLQGASAC